MTALANTLRAVLSEHGYCAPIPKRGQVTLVLERYQYPRATETRKVPATIVGALAIHRPTFHGGGQLKDRWTVSHVATGYSLSSAIPLRWWILGKCTATRAELIQWALDWQAACPEFFDLVADGLPDQTEEAVAITLNALNKGLSL